MVTKKFLRFALLGLLAFMLFCLVVMELTLHGDNWVRARLFHSHLPSNTSRSPATFTLSSSKTSSTLRRITREVTTVRTSTSSGQTGQNGVRNHTVLLFSSLQSNTATSRPTIPQRVRNSTVGSLSSGKGFHSSITTTTTTITTTTSSPNVTADVNHCLKPPTVNPGEFFNMQGQKLPDGSRPVNCSRCFHSRFPPLLQSCGICNTGVAGKGRRVELVIMILTTHNAADKRQAIRQTWASISRNNTADVRHVFVLGRSRNEAEMQKVRKEQEVHGDVIMYDFIDTYANLTLKTLTSMHWVSDFCYNTRFVMKTDDDMWVNVPVLLDTLQKQASTLHTAVGGACRFNAGPIRNRNSKWYASRKAYPQDSYPGYCSGTGYVTSVNVVRQVLSASPDVPFFYLEDVYVSLCVKRLGKPYRLLRLDGFFHGGGHPCILRGKGTITVHQVSPQTLRKIWAAKC